MSQPQLAHRQESIFNNALDYLDQVKVRFSEHPHVYDRLLDILKDFKSEAIDVPEVIEQVSNLFNGHPALILGFNRFLPDGYRIEYGVDGNPDAVRVITPDGTGTQSLDRRARASARFKHRREEKQAQAFASIALAEAMKHSHSSISPVTRPGPDRRESWHMTHRGEWRVENEVGAYETRQPPEQDIHESGIMMETMARERTTNTKDDCFFRKDMEKQGVA